MYVADTTVLVITVSAWTTPLNCDMAAFTVTCAAVMVIPEGALICTSFSAVTVTVPDESISISDPPPCGSP